VRNPTPATYLIKHKVCPLNKPPVQLHTQKLHCFLLRALLSLTMKGRPDSTNKNREHQIRHHHIWSRTHVPWKSQNIANCEPCKKPSPATLTFFQTLKESQSTRHVMRHSLLASWCFVMFHVMLLSWGAVMGWAALHRAAPTGYVPGFRISSFSPAGSRRI
jgi:hypothetical protein